MPTIALVDDDRNILTSVSIALEAEGYRIMTYTDGASALDGFKSSPPDLAILDIKMPRMDGMELLRRVRQKTDMPVIFLTSKDEEIDELFGLKMGADDFIRKPFSQRLLVERVKAVLRRGQPKDGAAPKEVANWHYDEVHRAFRSGMAAIVSDWPGYYGSYCEESSPVRGRFRIARMPAGPSGRTCCYAGSHTFALTRAGANKPEARLLLEFLTAPDQQAPEARQGSVPVRALVMEQQRAAADPTEAARLELLTASIEKDLIIPPKLPYYPEIEDILWRTVRAAMIGELAIPAALVQIEERIAARVKAHAAAR